MSRRLPALKPREVIRALEKAGFVVVRIKGSHHFMVHGDDRTRMTNVPAHASQDMPRGTLRDIIKQAGLTVDEFLDLL
jgi:predicted RNA binding protein YcfA (HicA-like mRNA interferase family)